MSTDINLSPFMNLPEPVVGSTDGPQWATNVNTSLTLIDRHNHTPGMGVPITTAGLNINSDLTFNNNSATSVKAVVFNPQSSFASNGSVYVIGTDLYYNNSSTGFPVQITNGNSIAGATGSITGLTAPASAAYVAPTFVWQSNANTPANLDAGSIILRNVVVNSRGLTLSPPTGLSVDYTLVLPTIPAVQSIMALDALGNISAPYTVDGSSIVINSNIIKVGTITNANIADNSINGAKIVDHSITDQQMLVTIPSYRNFIYNGAFDYWQRGTTLTLANTVTSYLADRWYAKNTMGGAGVLTYSRVAGTLIGSKYGASLQITTAPTSSPTNGCELYQTIDNLSVTGLLDRVATIAASIKALGRVNQVGIQFYYNTTEAKVNTALGTETLITVNTSTFVQGAVLAQAISSSTLTANGVIGLRIRITGVSSGNLYDLNNGFVVEQVNMTISPVVIQFIRQGPMPEVEFALCQYFYEKAINPVYVGSGTQSASTPDGTPGPGIFHPVTYQVTKRASPTVVILDPSTGTTNQMFINANFDLSGALGTLNYDVINKNISSFTAGFVAGHTSIAAAAITPINSIYFSWTADAEI